MSKVNRIFIVGQPGAGKALLAQTLAENLGWQSVNADLGLEYFFGLKVADILGNEGCQNLGRAQFNILNKLLEKDNIVINTDLSMISSESNQAILASELTIFLQVDVSTQLQRLIHTPKPLLLNNDIEKFLNELHQEYDGLLKQVSAFEIETDDNSLEEHIQKIINTFHIDKINHTQNNLIEKDFIFFHKTKHHPVHLTKQQALCLKLLAQGKSSKEIAKELVISYRTIEGTIADIMELLGCTSSKELIALYHFKP